MKNTIYSTLFFSFLLLLCSCAKVQHTTIDNDMKSHFNYKVGTYWIYKDSISGQVDSFVVYNNSVTNEHKDDLHTYDRIGIAINEYHVGSDILINYFGWLLTDNHVSVAETDKISTLIAAYDDFIRWPYVVGMTDGLDHDQLSVLNNFSIFTLNGVPYQNVWYVNHTIYPNPFNDRFWINSTNGILKMDLNRTGQPRIVWELQRSKIIL